jgi:hypothetical protein
LFFVDDRLNVAFKPVDSAAYLLPFTAKMLPFTADLLPVTA